MKKAKILILDDDSTLLQLLVAMMKRIDCDLSTQMDPVKALRLVETEDYDLVITDLMLPGLSGIEVTREILRVKPSQLIAVMSAQGNIALSVEALKAGAQDFIEKPILPEIFLAKVSKLLEISHTKKEYESLVEEYQISFDRPFILSKNKVMKQIISQIKRVASSPYSVVVSGESGTGKEIIARTIHSSSNRKNQPFVAVNCGALSDSILESELFGHVKGAFTGAVIDKIGVFEAANGGTLFLDEIGEVSKKMQVSLLRFLQEGEIIKVGTHKVIDLDVRIIAATNRSLRHLVDEGQFREDLFYRLNLFELQLPKLSDRKEDIYDLAMYFIDKACKDNKRSIKGIDRDALAYLLSYHWPGNIRELENTIYKAVLLSDGPLLTKEDLLFEPLQPKSQVKALNSTTQSISEQPTLLSKEAKRLSIISSRNEYDYDLAKAEFDRDYLIRLLEKTQGSITKAMKLSGKKRSFFYSLMKKHDIDLKGLRDIRSYLD